ncbi:MAG: metallophosphoesterase [Clostridia bacterium]|nr:metallophosphoesterase [Clostridia bacterium]
MSLNLVQKLFYKIFCVILSLFYSIAGGVVAPSTEDPIDVLNENTVRLTFATVADPQVSNYMFGRYRIFEAACMDLKNAEYDYDAVLLLGDVAENGLTEEYQLVLDGLSGINTRYIAITGNHDIRLRLYSQSSERFKEFANALNQDESMTEMHHSEVINGYKFITLGSDRTEFEETYLSEEQLAWLDDELHGENGNLTFVLCHQPLKLTHGLPDTWNSPSETAGSVGKQSDELFDILKKYDNVVFLSGHLHTGFADFLYEEKEGVHLVNVPSFSIENKTGEYNEAGLGFIAEVYKDELIFRARDFAKGIWLPEHDIKISIK